MEDSTQGFRRGTIRGITISHVNHGSTPHVCPVCGGRGLVPNGFYNIQGLYSSSSAIHEQCRTCKGTGVIWG
jgi:DnaJ-class molecular chaperone